MKKLFAFSLIALFIAQTSFAQNTGKDGYKIQVKFTDMKDTMLYLAHYFGKPLPTIYKTDSARFDKNGVATLQSNEKILGGIYMVLLADKTTYFEFLLNNGDNISITATAKQLPVGLVFKGSPENEKFLEYSKFLADYGKKQQVFIDDLKNAKNAADTEAIRVRSAEVAKELTAYRRNYVAKEPKTLLASIFNALEIPEVPAGKHLLADGTEDSSFAYNYYKEHYWDKFNFNDDRLINTPIYDMKLDEYMNRLVLPYEDSVEKEANILLAKTKSSKELFKYTLWFMTRFAENSKIMGMDAVFVYLVENYYMKGDAYWLTPEELEKYIDRAHKIAPNVIGNVAPELNLQDINKQYHKLSDVKAKYTLLIFWSPDCGHCQTEIPKLDSVYNAVLKSKGMKIYAVRSEGDEKKWQEMIKKEKLGDWINVYDPEYKSRFRSDYDVYSTPTIYLLDEKKIIRGKRIDYTNLLPLIEMLERKEKNESTKKSKS